MSAVWWSVLLVGVGTVLLKAAGPVLLGGRTLPPSLAGIAAAAVALTLRAPILVVVAVAAVTTALLRLVL